MNLMNLVIYCPIYNLYFFNQQGQKPFDFPPLPPAEILDHLPVNNHNKKNTRLLAFVQLLFSWIWRIMTFWSLIKNQ